MIKMLYGNINKISNEDINVYAQLLPKSMQQEISRYRYATDQKARILGRLMLLKTMKDAGKATLFEKLERDEFNKPFIEGWDAFNISHSGDLVVFCHAHNTVGIDIEKRLPLHYTGMLEHLHPEEQDFINRAENISQAFYKIWTRKEAFLKAIGLGIANGLKAFNCVNESVRYEGRDWYFYELFLLPEYSCHLCCRFKGEMLMVKTFNLACLALKAVV